MKRNKNAVDSLIKIISNKRLHFEKVHAQRLPLGCWHFGDFGKGCPVPFFTKALKCKNVEMQIMI